MTAVLHRNLRTAPPFATESFDSIIHAGGIEPVIDLSSGAGVTCLGHSCIEVKQAMVEQTMRLPYVHASNWTTDAAEGLAKELIQNVCSSWTALDRNWNEGRVMFLNSGAEAVEAACKLGIQYFREQRMNLRPQIMARQFSYHGNTIFTLALGDHPRLSKYAPRSPFHTESFPFCDIVRFPFESEGLGNLESRLQLCRNAHQPAIVVIEPIGGMTVGVSPPTTGYLKSVRNLCDMYGALLVYDEVFCGNYRTGNLFSWQYYSDIAKTALDPDIICIGKGLTAGYFPLSAVLVSGRVAKCIAGQSGQLWHSTTNQNHPIGCAAGLAALAQYVSLDNDLDLELATIANLLNQLDAVDKVTGVETLYGIHLDPYNPGLHERVKAKAMENGVAVYTGGGSFNAKGNFILLAPPLNITRGALLDGLEKLADAIKNVT